MGTHEPNAHHWVWKVYAIVQKRSNTQRFQEAYCIEASLNKLVGLIQSGKLSDMNEKEVAVSLKRAQIDAAKRSSAFRKVEMEIRSLTAERQSRGLSDAWAEAECCMKVIRAWLVANNADHELQKVCGATLEQIARARESTKDRVRGNCGRERKSLRKAKWDFPQFAEGFLDQCMNVPLSRSEAVLERLPDP